MQRQTHLLSKLTRNKKKKKKDSIGLILKRKRKKENDTCMEKKYFNGLHKCLRVLLMARPGLHC